MNKLLKISLAATACWLAVAVAAMAQDTNSLRTQIGLFEVRTGAILVKGSGHVGSLPLGPVELSVRCKQTIDETTAEKVHGLAVEIEGSQFGRDRILVDDDEVDGLLNAIDYLVKIKYDVTSLPGFEALYSTKAGLRVIADSLRKDGGVAFYVQMNDSSRIALTSVQMSQLYDLIAQGRKSLDALKTGK